DSAADPGWLDQFPRGIIAKLSASGNRITRAADEDWGYTVIPFTAEAARTYRITVDAQVTAVTAGKVIRGYLRERTGGSPAKVSDTWVSYTTTDATAGGIAGGLRVTYMAYYSEKTEVSMLFSMMGVGTAHTP